MDFIKVEKRNGVYYSSSFSVDKNNRTKVSSKEVIYSGALGIDNFDSPVNFADELLNHLFLSNNISGSVLILNKDLKELIIRHIDYVRKNSFLEKIGLTVKRNKFEIANNVISDEDFINEFGNFREWGFVRSLRGRLEKLIEWE